MSVYDKKITEFSDFWSKIAFFQKSGSKTNGSKIDRKFHQVIDCKFIENRLKN